jgi:uncharacterized membrane protein YccC
MAQSRWTEQEIADLVRMYPDKSISLAHLERHFGRRKGTIKQQARRLGLRRPNREWTEQDVADLTLVARDLIQRYASESTPHTAEPSPSTAPSAPAASACPENTYEHTNRDTCRML